MDWRVGILYYMGLRTKIQSAVPGSTSWNRTRVSLEKCDGGIIPQNLMKWGFFNYFYLFHHW